MVDLERANIFKICKHAHLDSSYHFVPAACCSGDFGRVWTRGSLFRLGPNFSQTQWLQEGQDHANTTLSSVFIISGAVQQLRQYNVASVLRTMVRVLVWKYHYILRLAVF